MSSPLSKSSTASQGGLTAEVTAIDVNCPIFKSGCGYCWTLSSAWGLTDAELCERCWKKHDEERKCPSCGRLCLDAKLWNFKRHTCLICKVDNDGPQK